MKKNNRKKVTFRLDPDWYNFLVEEKKGGRWGTLNGTLPILFRELKILRKFKANILKDAKTVVLIPPKYLNE